MSTRRLTIELIAIRAVLELPESPTSEAAERSDEFTADVLRAFRPLASTRPSNVVPFAQPLRPPGCQVNYAAYSPPSCISCGARIDYEPEDETGDACNDCWQESERKAQHELVLEFRWMSRDWLRCCGCSGTGIRHDQHCYCRKGQALHAAEAARFAFVRELPALAVCGAQHMAESGIDPQQRIAK
jgi:hypothetical protein